VLSVKYLQYSSKKRGHSSWRKHIAKFDLRSNRRIEKYTYLQFMQAFYKVTFSSTL
jgi:hypothetical protein